MRWPSLPPLRDKRRWIAIVGRVFVVVALLYFVHAFATHWSQISQRGVTLNEALVLAALSVAYGTSLYLAAENWHRILNMLARDAIERRSTYPSYGLTQIAKYLPGNVFHLVGRHVWLTRKGVKDSALIGASTLEVLVLVTAALAVVVLASLAAPVHVSAIVELMGTPLAIFALVAAAVAFGALLLRSRLRLPTLSWGTLAIAVCIAAVFFLIQGMIFFALCRLVEPATSIAVAGLATAAWLIGYLTPGSPGGIGSREVSLMLFLQGLMAEPNAVIAIALFRLVTTAGDLVCYLIAFFIWGRRAA
jgi:uncharacterized membrane protein YbhN (UPF0104 family)